MNNLNILFIFTGNKGYMENQKPFIHHTDHMSPEAQAVLHDLEFKISADSTILFGFNAKGEKAFRGRGLWVENSFFPTGYSYQYQDSEFFVLETASRTQNEIRAIWINDQPGIQHFVNGSPAGGRTIDVTAPQPEWLSDYIWNRLREMAAIPI